MFLEESQNPAPHGGHGQVRGVHSRVWAGPSLSSGLEQSLGCRSQVVAVSTSWGDLVTTLSRRAGVIIRLDFPAEIMTSVIQ